MYWYIPRYKYIHVIQKLNISLLNLMQKKMYETGQEFLILCGYRSILCHCQSQTFDSKHCLPTKKILSHHCIHRRGAGLLNFYIPLGTLDAVYTDRRKNLGEHAIHIWLCIHASIKETLVRCFSIESEILTITIRKGEYSTDFWVAHLVSLKIYAMG